MENVKRAECSFVDESDIPEDIRKDYRMKCELKSLDGNETVFVDEWSFHDSGMITDGSRKDYDILATFPGDCEVSMYSSGKSLTCRGN